MIKTHCLRDVRRKTRYVTLGRHCKICKVMITPPPRKHLPHQCPSDARVLPRRQQITRPARNNYGDFRGSKGRGTTLAKDADQVWFVRLICVSKRKQCVMHSVRSLTHSGIAHRHTEFSAARVKCKANLKFVADGSDSVLIPAFLAFVRNPRDGIQSRKAKITKDSVARTSGHCGVTISLEFAEALEFDNCFHSIDKALCNRIRGLPCEFDPACVATI